ncbi:hypothetical protein [Streptomyces sp. NPDC048106]|uniref:hypothetical protein n=1 Tax=Streptomyces sp. NPDC048106 TaxID=3155750 RepID=UPI0034525187
MFTVDTIRGLHLHQDAPLAAALAKKLADIDARRIHSTDELVLRKAVFGLLEIVAELEQRLIALEGPLARQEWSTRLATALGERTPDQVRLGE